ncbi:MAG TPA: hypothetical protein VIW68_14525 [Candidatus Sulfotelmatobacter sp.]
MLKRPVDWEDAVEAITVYVPTVPFAVNVGDVATPEALVVPVAKVLPLKVPPAPPLGAVKVTVAPDTGVPFDNTVADSVEVNAVLMGAFCWNGPVHEFTAVQVPAATVMIWVAGGVCGLLLQPVATAKARMIEAKALQ